MPWWVFAFASALAAAATAVLAKIGVEHVGSRIFRALQLAPALTAEGDFDPGRGATRHERA